MPSVHHSGGVFRRLHGPHGGDHDDRGARLLQRQGQAGARLETALPLMAPGLQGRACVSRAEEFQQLRPLLSSIVYRILGSVSEAESVVPSLTGTPRFVPIYRGGAFMAGDTQDPAAYAACNDTARERMIGPSSLERIGFFSDRLRMPADWTLLESWVLPGRARWRNLLLSVPQFPLPDRKWIVRVRCACFPAGHATVVITNVCQSPDDAKRDRPPSAFLLPPRRRSPPGLCRLRVRRSPRGCT